MRYQRTSQQVSYGEAIGILLLDSPVPFIPGDVANATTYDFPVRYKKVKGFTVEKALGTDEGIYPKLFEAALDLKENGVRAVTGDCGFMALHQERLKKDLGLPVFLSSLLLIPFIRQVIASGRAIGIITASQKSLTPSLLNRIGIKDDSDLVIEGLEECPEFASAVLQEKGSLDTGKIEVEILEKTRTLMSGKKNIGAILLECSVLPPYAKAVAEETGLPVFDYISMITLMFDAMIKKSYHGFM